MDTVIAIVGSCEGWYRTTRVPAVGEFVRLADMPRKVVRVEHLPTDAQKPEGSLVQTVTWIGTHASAVVTVADEE